MTSQEKITVIDAQDHKVPIEVRVRDARYAYGMDEGYYISALSFFGDGWREFPYHLSFDFVHYEYRIKPGHELPPPLTDLELQRIGVLNEKESVLAWDEVYRFLQEEMGFKVKFPTAWDVKAFLRGKELELKLHSMHAEAWREIRAWLVTMGWHPYPEEGDSQLDRMKEFIRALKQNSGPQCYLTQVDASRDASHKEVMEKLEGIEDFLEEMNVMLEEWDTPIMEAKVEAKEERAWTDIWISSN